MPSAAKDHPVELLSESLLSSDALELDRQNVETHFGCSVKKALQWSDSNYRPAENSPQPASWLKSFADNLENEQIPASLLQVLDIAWNLFDLSNQHEAAATCLFSICNLDRRSNGLVVDPVAEQMLEVELPLILAGHIKDEQRFDFLYTIAEEKLNHLISELLDGDGWVHAKFCKQWLQMTASWMRCLLLTDSFGAPILNEESAEQFEWHVRQTLRILDGSRHSYFDSGQQWCKSLITALVEYTADDEDQLIAQAFLPKVARTSLDIDDPASSISEWGEIGMLRSNWKKQSPRIAVTLHESQAAVSIGRERVWLTSELAPTIDLNGKPIQFDNSWEIVCWHSDDACDFLEMKCGTSDQSTQGTLYRHLLLGHQDQFVFMGDVFRHESAERIDYRLTLNVTDDIECQQEPENREIYLRSNNKLSAMVLPLNLNEWQQPSDPMNQFSLQDQKLTYCLSTVGTGIYSGLWIDLNSRRCCKPRTWRKLAVAESLRIVEDDEAVAFRIATGKEQWLIYRSLNPPVNRTFIGENHTCDFFAGKFSKGEVKEILTVE